MAKTITSPSELSLSTVQEIHNILTDEIQSGQDCILDLSKLCQLDTAGAQLLVAAHRAGVALEPIPDGVWALLEELGLAAELQREEGAP